MAIEIPRADYAVIGGSGTYSINFPESLKHEKVHQENYEISFNTPYGDSPSIKFFALGEKKVVSVKMHGWRPGVPRGIASQQLFWVFREAGVKRIIADGGVGSINHLLKPRDLMISSDYIDFSMRKDVGLDSPYLLVMRQAVCPEIRSVLLDASEKRYDHRVFDKGVYAVTDGRHFESRSEVVMLGRLGADIVGQSMCPEVYLAREIGACYARVDVVVNYGEGVIKDWEHSELKDIFYGSANTIALIVLDALDQLKPVKECGCPEMRIETLLK